MTTTTAKRRRFSAPVIVAGTLSSFLLALSMNGSVAAFVASITNANNTAGTGYLTMLEVGADGKVECRSTDDGGLASNSAVCKDINKYGGQLNMAPGEAVKTAIKIVNTGTIAATSFTMTADKCESLAQSTDPAQSGGGDICKVLNVEILENGTSVFAGTARDLDGKTLNLNAPIAAGDGEELVFVVTLDKGAGSEMAGMYASQPLTWTFTS